jgi:NADH-quinone oxidoreductase subunit J
MTAEVILFIAIGVISIVTAMLMLLSKNAVHSALFLIVNFIGVAVLYLMLEAPFLAMVQIAVYAGAIMVLFLFVIMLLGAERNTSGPELRRFPWLPAVGMGLVVFLVIAVGWALGRGAIDTQPIPDEAVTVRFFHAAPVVYGEAAVVEEPGGVASRPDTASDETAGDTVEATPAAEPTAAPEIEPAVDAIPVPADRVFALVVDGEVVDDSFVYGETTEFITLPPGQHVFVLRSADGTEVLTGGLAFEPGTATDVIVAGQDNLAFLYVPQSDQPGLRILNAYEGVPSIVVGDLQNEMFDPKVNEVTSIQTGRQIRPITGELPYTLASDPIPYPVGFTNWVVYQPQEGLIDADGFVADGDALNRQVLLRATETLDLEPGDEGLLIVSADNRPDGSSRIVGTHLEPVQVTAYGSPQSLGERLFTEYLLPFQLVAVLLLAAMIGVIVITVRGEHVPKPSRTTRRKVSRPLTSVIASQTGTDLTSGAPQLPERTETPAGD